MRRARIDLRVTPAEKDAWEAFAREHGLDLSKLIRRSVNQLLKVAHPATKKRA